MWSIPNLFLFKGIPSCSVITCPCKKLLSGSLAGHFQVLEGAVRSSWGLLFSSLYNLNCLSLSSEILQPCCDHFCGVIRTMSYNPVSEKMSKVPPSFAGKENFGRCPAYHLASCQLHGSSLLCASLGIMVCLDNMLTVVQNRKLLATQVDLVKTILKSQSGWKITRNQIGLLPRKQKFVGFAVLMSLLQRLLDLSRLCQRMYLESIMATGRQPSPTGGQFVPV